jgi:pyruvate dehydrogenase E1 component alpha subunit
MKKINKDGLLRFEEKICEHWESGDLPFLIHLSGGNEDFLIDFFSKNIIEGDWIFSTHRNHYHALLSGVDPSRLEHSILVGNSMFTFSKARNFFTSSVLAGTCCIAAGVAWALKLENSENKVWCFLGDGAEEEGHFYEAVMMVQGHNLPCKFIIEDNDRSVDSSRAERLPNKYRIDWPDCVIRNAYSSTFPHAGNGTKKIIDFKNINLTN